MAKSGEVFYGQSGGRRADGGWQTADGQWQSQGKFFMVGREVGGQRADGRRRTADGRKFLLLFRTAPFKPLNLVSLSAHRKELKSLIQFFRKCKNCLHFIKE